MNEEIEYAEMLEIPVSTVNLVQKKRAKKSKQSARAGMKKSVITQVNAQLSEAQEPCVTADAEQFAESANSEGTLILDGVPERIDTVRVYSEEDKAVFEKDFADVPRDGYFIEEEAENNGGRYETKWETRKEKRIKILLNAEFAAACALCGIIFVTNVFMPNSAINTFFRGLTENNQAVKADDREYSEFTLAPLVSERAAAELTLSETGVVSLLGDCCVYPTADGKVCEVTQNEDGTYTLKLAYSTSFTGVMTGLTEVYYQTGDSVKANVPIGYTDGEKAVEVVMYASGTPLSCLSLTEENCLAWLEQ